VIRRFALAKDFDEKTKELSQKEGVTLFTTLVAGFAALLHRYTQQDDIIVGTPSPAGRKRLEVEKLLGYFLNPVALRFDLSGDPSFRGLLQNTQQLALEAFSNDDVPLEWLAREMQPNVDPIYHPFFTVAMSLQPPMPSLDLEWSVTSMDADSGGAPWELYIAFISQPAGMAVRVQYNPDLFEAETITQMLNDYQGILESMCANPSNRLSQVELGPSWSITCAGFHNNG
jgi:non-ribosomal peptide synthetase component F